MGFNISWIAVKGGRKTAILDELGLEEADEASDAMSAPLSCARLPNGWLIIAATDRNFDLEKALATTSAERFVLGCEMSETLMFSEVCAFQQGRRLWSVTHDPDSDPEGVEITGAPPKQLVAIRGRLEAERAGDPEDVVDYMFELPVELAASICGYRPEKGSAANWSVLRKTRADRRGAEPGRTSLAPTVKSRLYPLMLSLGWEEASKRPDLVDEPSRYEFVRLVGGLLQTMWFDFGWVKHVEGDTPDLSVGFTVRDRGAPDERWCVLAGHSYTPNVAVPFWKHVRAIFGKPPAPKDHLIPDVMDRAGRHIIAADSLLKTGARHPEILIGRGLARDTWPALPEGVPYLGPAPDA